MCVTDTATINEIDATHTDTDTLNVGTAATAAKLVVDNVTIDSNKISSTGDLVLDTPSGLVDVNQKLSIDSTEASTSAATGALRVAGGIGIGVSILSYDNKVEFGFVADAALVPEPQAMIDDFVDEFKSIQAEVLGAPAFSGELSRA